MDNYNPILDTDSYKQSHYRQYPSGTRFTHSYIESRGGEFKNLVFFGLQHYLLKYLSQRVTMDHVNEADEFCHVHGEPFNREGWEYIVTKLGGRMPVRIRAPQEGTLIPAHEVMLTVENTDINVPWITTFIETALLRAVWYPTTVATISHAIKTASTYYHLKTVGGLQDFKEGLPFVLNDFGSRGVSSLESAEIGGLAHLALFKGTDNMMAVRAARKYYDEPMAGFSIPAAEHSTITAWGDTLHNETSAYHNMVDKFGKFPLVAVVSDSYDIDRAVDKLWTSGGLLEKVKSWHESHGTKVVIRPDSGDLFTPVNVIEKVMEKCGYTTNDKGYKMLPPYFGVIQGDGVNHNSINEIYEEMTRRKIAANNLVFGMGGALLQQLNRDTCRFAMKLSAIDYQNNWRDAYKCPKGDPTKASKKGRMELFHSSDGLVSKRIEDAGNNYSIFRTVFENGQVLQRQTLNEIQMIASDSAFKQATNRYDSDVYLIDTGSPELANAG